jgi:hypothetical protein
MQLPAQVPSEEFLKARDMNRAVIEGDTIYYYKLPPLLVFGRPSDMRKYERLVRNVKMVYPYAKEAKEYMLKLETEMMALKTERERDKFTKEVEKEIVKKYTPILKKMTFSQGKVLIKLIDRETQQTSFSILKEFRGGFSASFWNTVARLFSANLKDTYDPSQGEDAIIEHIIIMYEAGLL